jgi:2-polyprenyl-3-methyl-5-hydroxy-6-metoxy-1,4-benzoquinol methylase
MKLSIEQVNARESFLNKFKSGEYKTVSNPCVCGINSDTLISKKDRYGIDLETKLCNNCGLVRSDPYYDTNTLSSFYASEYRSLYTDDAKPSNEFFDHEVLMGNVVLKNIQNVLPEFEIKNSVIYEIGCGGGGILYPFKNIGANVFGCDLGNEYLEIGKSNGMNLVQGDIEVLEQFGKADLIIMHHVVEHFLNPVERLSKAISLLKPNGILYIAVPGLWTHVESYGALLNYLQNAHVYNFTRATLSNLLQNLGMLEVFGNEKVVGIYRNGTNDVKHVEDINKLRKFLQFSSNFGMLNDIYSSSLKGIKKITKIVKGK